MLTGINTPNKVIILTNLIFGGILNDFSRRFKKITTFELDGQVFTVVDFYMLSQVRGPLS